MGWQAFELDARKSNNVDKDSKDDNIGRGGGGTATRTRKDKR